MKQYSVMLVDDEEDAIQVLKKKLDWETMGFVIAGTARNGVEALELADELQPDVVMTDIKMPYMDGLELCKRLRKIYEKVKVIIFSGFDEFEFAKEAIKIEAEEYILKPINVNELREVFQRTKLNLDKERDEKRNIDHLKEYYLKSLPILQENFYTSLLEGHIPDDKLEQLMEDYRIDLMGPYYVVTALHISLSKEDREKMNPFLWVLSVKNLLEEQLECKKTHRLFTYLGDIIVISQFEQPSNVIAFTDEMNRICKMAKRVCEAKVTAGIGQVCNGIDELSGSYQGARNAVSYRVIYGNTRSINIAEIAPKESVDVPWEEDYIKNILKKIKMGEEEKLQNVIDEFVEQLVRSRVTIEEYHVLLMELLAEMLRFGNENQLNMEKVFEKTEDLYGQMTHLESKEALGEWLKERCSKMLSLVEKERKTTAQSMVGNAIDFVKENYIQKDLSIEMVCKSLNVSAAYFSTIFKKETGKTFINYLTDYRMKQALDLLLVKNEKTYIVADQVGYADPNYFSYVFKKQFGMSPSKYKMSKMVNRENQAVN